MEEHFETVKDSILTNVRDIFNEIEEGIARSHEEKYAVLEDALGNASDVDELRVAFEQWFADHADDLELEYEFEELWDTVMANVEAA